MTWDDFDDLWTPHPPPLRRFGDLGWPPLQISRYDFKICTYSKAPTYNSASPPPPHTHT